VVILLIIHLYSPLLVDNKHDMKKTDRDRDIQTDSRLHKVTHKYTNNS